jgi:hypothetical protein
MLALMAATGFAPWPAMAAPHAAFRPLTARNVATYRHSGTVGPMVFCLTFPEAQADRPPSPLTQLTFHRHQPPASWWGRSYHPCTLNDAIASLPDAARQFRVATVVILDGQRISGTAFDLADEQLGPTWNTLSWDGSAIRDALASLTVGRHQLTVWRQLHYRLPAKDRQTGETVWEPRMLALAKGDLPVIVQP